MMGHSFSQMAVVIFSSHFPLNYLTDPHPWWEIKVTFAYVIILFKVTNVIVGLY